MFLFDPDRGTRRRNLIRDQAQSKMRTARKLLDERAHRLANRARGLVADVRSELDLSPVPDVVLEERVRAALGHTVPHAVAHAVQVNAENGRVTLSGKVPGRYIDRLIVEADRVHGVVGVHNVLDILNGTSYDGDMLKVDTGVAAEETMQTLKWPLAMIALGVAGAALTYYVQNRAESCNAEPDGIKSGDEHRTATGALLDRNVDPNAPPPFVLAR
jgi:hypothetical protein